MRWAYADTVSAVLISAIFSIANPNGLVNNGLHWLKSSNQCLGCTMSSLMLAGACSSSGSGRASSSSQLLFRAHLLLVRSDTGYQCLFRPGCEFCACCFFSFVTFHQLLTICRILRFRMRLVSRIPIVRCYEHYRLSARTICNCGQTRILMWPCWNNFMRQHRAIQCICWAGSELDVCEDTFLCSE